MFPLHVDNKLIKVQISVKEKLLQDQIGLYIVFNSIIVHWIWIQPKYHFCPDDQKGQKGLLNKPKFNSAQLRIQPTVTVTATATTTSLLL